MRIFINKIITNAFDFNNFCDQYFESTTFVTNILNQQEGQNFRFITFYRDSISFRDPIFLIVYNGYKFYLSNWFCKVELGLEYIFNMVSESILTRLLDLLGHPLLSRYRTILTYKLHVRVEESWREEDVLGISYWIQISPYKPIL